MSMNEPPTLSPASPPATGTGWNLIHLLAFLMLLAGGFVRVQQFAIERSLWIDEAVLADNIISRDYAGLTSVLDHNQIAPVGYLWLAKLATQCIGDDEQGLRLVSLLAGLLTLPMLWLMGRTLLSPVGSLIVLTLGGFSLSLIYYSNEVKPYSLDALATATTLWLGLRAMQRSWDVKSLLLLALVGAVAVWISLAAVFVVAGMFIAAMFVNRQTSSRSALVRIIIAGVLPGVSFLLHFLLFLRDSMGSDAMQNYWAADFLPLPPRSLKQIEWFIITPLQYFTDPGGYRAIGLAFIVAIAGLALWWRKQRTALLLITMPILLLLIASGLKKYPIPTSPDPGEHWYGRLILFTLPIALFAMAAGIDRLQQIATRSARAAALLILALLLVHPMIQVTRNLRSSASTGDVRTILTHLSKHQQPGDLVYPNWPMRQLAAYYRHRIELSDPSTWLTTHPVLVRSMLTDDAWTKLNDWANWEKQLLALRGQRVWLLLSHEPSAGSKPDEKFLYSIMQKHGRVLDELKTEEASIYLVQVREDPLP